LPRGGSSGSWNSGQAKPTGPSGDRSAIPPIYGFPALPYSRENSRKGRMAIKSPVLFRSILEPEEIPDVFGNLRLKLLHFLQMAEPFRFCARKPHEPFIFIGMVFGPLAEANQSRDPFMGMHGPSYERHGRIAGLRGKCNTADTADSGGGVPVFRRRDGQCHQRPSGIDVRNAYATKMGYRSGYCNPLISLAGQEGFEPPTLGFGVP
jgi:hypothetical protein